MNAAPSNPFSPRAVLALVVFGAAVFVALLYMIGSGMTGSTNDGGGHAGGKGLNGYAAFAGYLEKRGYTVRRTRAEGSLDKPGLLVLTPPASADGGEIEKVVNARRAIGPTLVIAPKWQTAPTGANAKGAKSGWVELTGTQSPSWSGFLDDVSVDIKPLKAGGWAAGGLHGPLPDPKVVQSGKGPQLSPLVESDAGDMLAAYLDDGGYYPALAQMSVNQASEGDDDDLYPVVVVFEPDLLDNYGFADRGSAQLADRLVAAMGADRAQGVSFDLTLNGLGRSANLLTLAFTPPFLAATLCLLLAAVVVGWRAFLRFGPPRVAGRAIAFGKRALVANAAGLIRRTRRLHLIAAPYAARARDRLVRSLAITRHADVERTEAAIDRALAARRPDAPPFSAIAARLRAARSPHDILKAAQDLHAIERTLIR